MSKSSKALRRKPRLDTRLCKEQSELLGLALSLRRLQLLYYLFLYLQLPLCWFNLEGIYELETQREIKSRTCIFKLGNNLISVLGKQLETHTHTLGNG